MSAVYNLALFAPIPAVERLRYLFVPVGLEAFAGYEQFSAVWRDGRPAGCVLARTEGLASLRDPATPDKQLCSAERFTIEQLFVAAQRGGFSLPNIAPTLRQPLWAGVLLEAVDALASR